MACAFVLAACGLAACSGTTPKSTPAAVSGWYVRDIGDGREIIDLRPNGDYMHVVAIRGTPTRTDAAHWRAAGDSMVTLDFFRDAAEVGHGVARPDSVRAAVHAIPGGELRLDVASDSASFTRRLRYAPKRGG